MFSLTFAAALTLFHGPLAGPQSAFSILLMSYINTDILSIFIQSQLYIYGTSCNENTISKVFQQMFLFCSSNRCPKLVSDSYFCDLYSRNRNSHCEKKYNNTCATAISDTKINFNKITTPTKLNSDSRVTASVFNNDGNTRIV